MKRSRNATVTFPGSKNQPWLDSSGNSRSDSELKEISKTWSPETWEEYLSSLETHEPHYLSRNFQKLLEGSDAKEVMRRYFGAQDFERHCCSPEEAADLSDALHLLGERELRVIQAVIFEDLSQQEAATRMKISQQRVSKLFQSALVKLRTRLVQ